MFLTHDLSKLDPALREAVVKHVQHEDKARYDLARVEQARLAQFYRNAARPGTTKDGFGPMNMALMPYFANLLKLIHGEDWMQDPDKRKWIRQRYEEFAVPETGTRVQSGWTPQTRE